MNDGLETTVAPPSEKTVNDLKGYSFVIPEYQRGYKWEKTQVKELLDDIYSFDTNQGKSKYCLQPIVVKRLEGDNRFEVVDGQQRLTTLFLIIRFSDMTRAKETPPPYAIEYSTRGIASWNYLNGGLIEHETDRTDNSDFYHMRNAWDAIGEWIAEKGIGERAFDRDVVARVEDTVLLIWYEIPESQDAVSTFRRLNIGKIPLTNAELMKALIISNAKRSKSRALSDKISVQWDRIEHSLQKDSLWFFLTDEKNIDLASSTRIDLLFNIWADAKSGEKSSDPYRAFRLANRLLAEGNCTAESLWTEIEDIFSTLAYWYDDHSMYHRIGYLIASGAYMVDTLLIDLKQCDKSQTEAILEEKIAKTLEGIDSPDAIKGLAYSNDTKENKCIRRVLLLFNILTILESGAKSTRFPFDIYKKEDWDIEHIHATAQKPPKDSDYPNGGAIESRRKYFLQLIDLAQDYEIAAFSATREIDRFFEDDGYADEAKSQELLDLGHPCRDLLDSIVGEQNGIANLTLLDSGTNRSYGDDSFESKRRIIKDRDREAIFIPPCTRNVFLKYYSEGKPDTSFTLWDKNDRKGYIEGQFGLLETLKPYLKESAE